MKSYQTPTRAIFAAVAVLGMLLGSVSAAAAQTYTSQDTIQLSATPQPGLTITISGEGFPGDEICVWIDGNKIQCWTIVDNGAVNQKVTNAQVTPVPFSFSFAVPSNLSAGTHNMSVTRNGTIISTTSFTVAASSGGATNSQAAQLPDTGGETVPMAQMALGMIGAGTMVLIGRRRFAAS